MRRGGALLWWAVVAGGALAVGGQGVCGTGGVFDSGGGVCETCPSGSRCPGGSSEKVACAPGSYQPLRGREECLVCPLNGYCPDIGGTDFLLCPTGLSSSPGSSTCDVAHCRDAEEYWDGTACVAKTRCDYTREYHRELASGDRECVSLTPCDFSAISPSPKCVDGGGVEVVECDVLRQYAVRLPTKTSDWVCESWRPCTSSQYLFKGLVADSKNLIVKRQECRERAVCDPGTQFTLLDGSVTGDRNTVCGTITYCEV